MYERFECCRYEPSFDDLLADLERKPSQDPSGASGSLNPLDDGVEIGLFSSRT